MKQTLTIADVYAAIRKTWRLAQKPEDRLPFVYGIPRGGVPIALMLEREGMAMLAETPEDADLIVDDIIDSGRTADAYEAKYSKPVWAPYDKTKMKDCPWLVFPWEESAEVDAQELIVRMLQMIGEDPKRPGLLETPDRVVRSWTELFAGYMMDAKEVLGKVFDSENKNMVICRNVEFYSMCEHHMLPFTGSVSLAYIPDGKVVGLSKLARVVEVYARRLQIQEGLTDQIAQAMHDHIPSVQGVAVVVKAKHSCMSCRGVGKQNSDMVTSAIRGKFKFDPAVRAELYSLLAL